MKLVKANVRMFRNILDSTPVTIQPDVTCLVGKNESGKTAFLHALWRARPARQNVSFSAPDHYPAWREKKDRLSGNLEVFKPISVTFELDATDRAFVENVYGPKALRNNELTLTRE